MKKYLSTGLVILLPLVLTFLIVSFLVNILTKPFLGLTESLIASPTFIANHPVFILVLSKLLILCSLLATTFIIGLIGKLFLIDYLFRLGSKLIQTVPVINRIYKACQDVVNSLFSSSSKSFSQVVFVPFPTPHSLSVGLVTKEEIVIKTNTSSTELIPVFVPGTPNPSVGFLIMFKKEQLIFVNMKIEEAMKFVVSCGVVLSDFIATPQPQTDLNSDQHHETL